MINKKLLSTTLLLVFVIFFQTHSQDLSTRLQAKLDSLRTAGNFPGLSVAIISADGKIYSLASGMADKEKNLPLTPESRLLAGSVGKTFVAAIALQMIADGKFSLDDKVSKYLGVENWYSRIPNATDITVRHIMNHTSGVMRYEFKEKFMADLTSNSSKEWKPEELLSYVLDEKAEFAAGAGWDYSDTNYILLGMIMEKVSGEKYYDLLEKRILKKEKLNNTAPSDKIKLKGLVQGYAGAENDFGKKDKMIDEKGSMIVNPQFEWTGGGVYTTPTDLARWSKLLYEGKIIPESSLEKMFEFVPAKLGKDAGYGLGAISRPSPFGATVGHSGFYPGYMTDMIYFRDKRIAISIQANTSDFKNLKIGLYRCAMELMKVVQTQN